MKIGGTIYLDHQATTPTHPEVFTEMSPYFLEFFGNPHSSDHPLGWEAAGAVESGLERIARLIGADPDEITFTSGATESNNLALLGLGRRHARGRRRRILLSATEHKCVLAAGRVLRDQDGYEVEEIPVDCEGFVNLSALEEAIDDKVLAVSVMAVNNEIGTIQDIARISELARDHGAMLHCDAAQAPLAGPINHLAALADTISLSAHKMYGPKGIGVFYTPRHLREQIEPLIHGGGQQEGLRSGTLPVPLCVGMGVAAEMLLTDHANTQRVELRQRRDRFIEKLRNLPWAISLNGPQGDSRHPGNANIRFHSFSAHDILGALQPKLAASTGSACTSGTPEPSHVLRAIGLNSDEANASIRFSLGFGTTDEDVDEAVDLIGRVLERLPTEDFVVSV